LRKIHYGWVIVASASFIFATNALSIYSFGVFLTPLTQEFNWDRGELSAAFSAGILVAGFLSTITGRISDRYGPRGLVAIGAIAMAACFFLMSLVNSLWQVYLTWGVFLGLGIGCTVTPINATIPRWFSTKMGLAVAIPSAGFGVGSVLAPLLVQWLLTLFDWRQAFIVLAVIRLVIALPLTLLVRRDPRDIGIRPFGDRKSDADFSVDTSITGTSFTQAMKSRRFWFFALTHFGFGFCLQTIIVHTVPNAIDVGLTAVVAAGILSIVAGASILGMLSAGFVADRLGSTRLMSICLVVTTVALAWLIIAGDVWMFYLFAAVYGFFYGAVIPLWTLVSAELFGFKSLGSIFGTVILLGTIGGAIGTPMSGLIFDITGSYDIALIVAAGISMLTIVSSLLLRRYRQQISG